MSAQQVQRLQTLLETVQRNRQRPGEPIGAGANAAAASVVQKKPANMTAAAVPADQPPRARVATPELPVAPAAPQAPAAAQARPAKPAPQAPPQVPPSQPKVPIAAPAARAPEPQPAPQPVAAPEPIVPRVIEPDAPRAATRPIAQLVSKHAPVVDATFGAMLKRSLSLRPH
jgi:hypothetical protein